MVAVGATFPNVQVMYIGVLASVLASAYGDRGSAGTLHRAWSTVPGASATKLYYVLCIPHRMPSVDIIKILHSWVACETD